MNKLRLSYTLLDLWQRNRIEDAINYYFKTADIPETDALLEGKAWDSIIQHEIEKKSRLPDQFGGMKVAKEFKCQLKITKSISNTFDLVGVLDGYWKNTIYEFKTGYKSSFEYTNSPQLGIYSWLCSLKGIETEKIIVIRYNQHEGKYDWSQVWVTEEMKDKAKNFVFTVGDAIHSYFISEGLL